MGIFINNTIIRLIELLKVTGEDQRFRAALSESLAYAINDILMRKVYMIIYSIRKQVNDLGCLPISY